MLRALGVGRESWCMCFTFRGETLLEANLHTTLGPSHIVLESRHPRVAIDALRYLSGLPDDEAP